VGAKHIAISGFRLEGVREITRFCVITQRVVKITDDALLLAVRSDSPEIVEISRRVLFLSSSRVWGFLYDFFF
jgi:hypothetical protein